MRLHRVNPPLGSVPHVPRGVNIRIVTVKTEMHPGYRSHQGGIDQGPPSGLPGYRQQPTGNPQPSRDSNSGPVEFPEHVLYMLR